MREWRPRQGSTLQPSASKADALSIERRGQPWKRTTWQTSGQFAIAGAYLIILLAQRSNPLSKFADRWGDLSYGVYLFGWPIQSMLDPLTITSFSEQRHLVCER